MLVPSARAGMSTSSAPTAASRSPLTSAAGAVQAGHGGRGEPTGESGGGVPPGNGGAERIVKSLIGYATQCQVANSATKNAMSRADAASAGLCARGCSANHMASQMLSGNSTTRKRGSDIRG
jgi:hypothetical protein